MYFEDFQVGQHFQGEPVTISLEEIYEFAHKYDPLPIHTDPDFAEDSIYHGIIASGFHTLCAIWGQWVRLKKAGPEVIGGIGIDFLNWTAPVRPNDRLTADFEVVGLIPSSKGGRGILVLKVKAFNQNGQVVMTAQVKGMVKSKTGGRMDIIIRQERSEDHAVVRRVIAEAFKNEEFSSHDEHLLVERLRKRPEYLPQLSLVAEINGNVVGHILFTPIEIKNGDLIHGSLALAPVSVLPEFQKCGVGKALINEGLSIAKMLGFKSVIVLGHPDYYPKFGFEPAKKWGISAPFDVPEEIFFALELEKSSLEEVTGMVVYPSEFMGE